MYVFLFEVEYYDSFKDKTITAYHAVRAEKFVDAVEQVEDYYGNELCGFTVDCLEDDLIQISEETYNKMLKGEL